jgi:potassium-transporting ATPase KdpC subunit
MKHLVPSLRMLLFLTLILGFGYPLLMTGLSKAFFSSNANGSLIEKNGQVIGSSLIGQKFEKPQYFWSRPSAIDYNPQPSGGSNLGPISKSLKATYEERLVKIKAAHPDQEEQPPQELLFASASGLDPHISLEAARYQMNRVAQARGMGVERIESLLIKVQEGRQLGFLGEARVNVLMLNLALDQMQAQ